MYFKYLTPLLLTFLLLNSSCSSNKWVAGNWHGTGDQVDGHAWAVDLSYENKSDIQIDYPDLSCGGIWEVFDETKKEIVFKETIKYGVWRCDQGVEAIVSKINKQSIKVAYYLRSYDLENPIAEAILYKVDDYESNN